LACSHPGICSEGNSRTGCWCCKRHEGIRRDSSRTDRLQILQWQIHGPSSAGCSPTACCSGCRIWYKPQPDCQFQAEPIDSKPHTTRQLCLTWRVGRSLHSPFGMFLWLSPGPCHPSRSTLSPLGLVPGPIWEIRAQRRLGVNRTKSIGKCAIALAAAEMMALPCLAFAASVDEVIAKFH